MSFKEENGDSPGSKPFAQWKGGGGGIKKSSLEVKSSNESVVSRMNAKDGRGTEKGSRQQELLHIPELANRF